MKKNYFKFILTCCIAFFIANCEGEDGVDGVRTDGLDGVDGINGVDGVDGIDGLGFNELVEHGSIHITLEGTRPDDIPFTNTTEFRFNSVEGNDIEDHNGVVFDENSISFEVKRFISAPDDTYQDSNASFDLIVTDPESETPSFELSFGFEEFAVTFDTYEYFQLDNSFNYNDEITNLEITNYSFDDTTNNLIFSFSFDVAAENNDSGHDLSISGEVDVIVLELIVPNE